ncbi:MAG: hypothetical protein ACK5IM_05620, partial [Demequina sp.]|uniref:hypothetical protein n=1 Tax=Demequina sp. TaxID=2050685 RepID=UPI003A860D08
TRTSQLSIARSPLNYLTVARTNPTVAMDILNAGDADAEDVTATIALPEGLTFTSTGSATRFASPAVDALAVRLAPSLAEPFTLDGWLCALSTDARVLTCDTASVGAGAGAGLNLAVAVDSDALDDDASTTFTVDAGDQHVTYSVATGVASDVDSDGLAPTYTGEGGVGATQVGGTLMGCTTGGVWSVITDPHNYCKNVMQQTANGDQRKYNNNAYFMVPLNEHGGDTSSGVTELTLPEGATVTRATLEWSANRPTGSTWSRSTDNASFKVPGATYETVEADRVTDVTRSGRTYYLASADVTSLVASAGEGEYSVADIALARGLGGFNLYGGFTLTVIYDDPSADDDTTITVLEGPHWADDSAPVVIPFHLARDQYVTASWTAYETDRGFINDQVRISDKDEIGGRALRPERERGNGDSGNAADSTAFGSPYANTLGIDAKPFEPALITKGKHNVVVTTTRSDEQDDDGTTSAFFGSGDDFLIGTIVVTLSDTDPRRR